MDVSACFNKSLHRFHIFLAKYRLTHSTVLSAFLLGALNGFTYVTVSAVTNSVLLFAGCEIIS